MLIDCVCINQDCSLVACPTYGYRDIMSTVVVGTAVEGDVSGALVRQLDYGPNRKLCLKRLAIRGVPTPVFDLQLYRAYWRLYRDVKWFKVDTAPWRVVAVDYHYSPVDAVGAFILRRVGGGKYVQLIELEAGPTWVKTVAGVELFIHVDYGGGYNLVFAVSWHGRATKTNENVRAELCYYWCYPNRQDVPELSREGCLQLYESLVSELNGARLGPAAQN